MPTKSIGYARTANNEPDISIQVDALKAVGCAEVFIDKAQSGSTLDRPGLCAVLAALSPGDTLKVCDITRISRTTPDLISFVSDLAKAGIDVQSLSEAK